MRNRHTTKGSQRGASAKAFIRHVLRLGSGMPQDEAPSIENLEPRVLLSANPLADAVKYQDNDLLNYQSAIFMPLSAGPGNAAAPVVEQNTTISILSPEYNAQHNGQVDVTASILQGDSEISKWTVKLVYEDTGRSFILKNGTGLPTPDHLLSFNSRYYGAGACRIEIDVVDKAGSTVSASRAFSIDLAAPSVSIASPAYNSSQKGAFEVVGSVADSDSADEMVSWTLSLKDASGTIIPVSEGIGKRDKAALGTIDPTRLVSGSYTILLEARDAAGNSRSASLPVRIDGFAPKVTLSSDIQEVDSRQYVTFSIGATDDIGVSSRKLIINGITHNVGANGIVRIRLDKAGVFEAVAEVTDAAGNVGRAMMQVTVRDVYKPEVALNAPANNASLGTATEIYAYIRDNDSPSTAWTLTLTNKATGEKFSVAAGTRVTSGSNDRVLLGQLDPGKYANGDYLLTLEIVDTAGNTAKSEITVRVDTIAPTIESVAMNKTAVETFQPVVFSIKASDNFAVTRYELFINGEKVSVYGNGSTPGYTFKEAGVYTVEAYAYDAAGNAALHTFTLPVTETPDLKAPVITISSPANNFAYNKNVGVQVYIRDVDSLVITWTVKLINNTTGEEKLLGSGDRETYYQTVATLSPGEYADGSYTVLVEAVDKGGNRTVVSNSFTFDTVKPEVFIEPETPRLEVGQTIWFQIAEKDASTISRRTLQINGKNVSVDASGRAKYVFDASGEYTLTVTSTDAAGNVGTVAKTIVITGNTDFIAPTVEITSPDALSYNGGMTSIKGSISDSDSESITWTVRLRYPNGVSTIVLATGIDKRTDAELARFNATSYPSGVYTIEVEAVDPAGNTTVATRAITIDRYAPTVSITGPATNAFVKDTTDVTGSLTDPDTAVEFVSWAVRLTNTVTGEIFTIATGKNSPVDGRFATIDPTLYASGTYTLTLEAVDAGGNKASTSRPVRIDGFAPEVTVSSDIQEVDSWQYVTFTIGATDDVGVSSRKLVINGITHNVGSNGIARIRLDKAGVFEVVAEVTDAAGNVGRAMMQVTVRDANKPEVTLNAPANNASLGAATEVYAYIRDNDSPSADWTLTLTNKATGEKFVVAAGTRITTGSYDRVLLGQLDPAKYGNGDYLLTLEIADTSGNTAKSEINVRMDTIAPVIESVSMNQTAVETFKPVIFTVNASDNFAIAKYELFINGGKVSVYGNGSTPGYTFKEAGTYTIEAFAYDAAGNVAAHTFNLVVKNTADIKAPDITINSPGNNAFWNRDIPVQVYIRDVDSLVINWNVKLINNATGAQKVLGSGNREAYYQTVATLKTSDYTDGSYTILVEAIDKAGNRSEKSATFTLDTTAPVVDFRTENAVVLSGTFVNFITSDSDSNAISSRSLVVNGITVPRDANGRGVFMFDGPGKYVVTYTVRDVAGNTGSKTYTLTVGQGPDVTAPTIASIASWNNSYVNSTRQIYASITDPDSPWVNWTSRIINKTTGETFPIGQGQGKGYTYFGNINPALYADGEYEFIVDAVDVFGNSSRQTCTLFLDAIKPDVSVTADKSVVKTGSSVTFTVNATDNLLLNYSRLLVDGRWLTLDSNGQGSHAFSKVGEYDAVAYAYDKAGNVSTHTIRISVTEEVVADTEDPVVDIRHNAPSTMNPGQSVEFVVDANDNVGVVSLTLTINEQIITLDANHKGSFTFTAAGTYTIIAKAYDAAGNEGVATTTLTVTAAPDTEKPVVSISSNAPSTMYPGQSVEFFVDANDNIGVTSRTLTIDGQTITLDANYKGSFTFSAVGTYTITAKAYDAAGNVGVATTTLTVTAAPDTEKPVVSISSNAPSTMYPGQSVEFFVDANDNVGVTSRTLTIDGQTIPLDANYKGSFTFTKVGVYTFIAKAYDAVGNEGVATTTLTVTAAPDTEKPVVSISSNAPSTMYPGQSVEFFVNANDNVGVTSRTLTIDGQSITLDANYKGSFTFTKVGVYTFIAKAYDAVGNEGVATTTLTVTAAPDTEKPVVSISSNAPSTMYPGQSVEFFVNANDNIGVTSRTLTIDGQSITLDANYKGSFTFTKVGVYTFIAKAYDAVGNEGVATTTLTVTAAPDTEKPVVSISSNAPSTMYPGQSVEFFVNANDNIGVTSRTLTIDGQSITLDANYKGSFTFTKVGVYTFIAKAYDAVGNEGVATTTLTVTAAPDTEKPVVSISSNAPSTMYPGQSVEFFVNANDNIGVTSRTLTIDGQSITLDANYKGSFTFTKVGVYTFIAKAYDVAGNEGVATTTLTVVPAGDTEDPVVSLSHDGSSVIASGRTVEFTVKANDNVGVDSVTLTVNGQPVAIGAAGRASYLFSHPGSYEIIATATDLAGNSGTKRLTITVMEPAARPDLEKPSVTLTHNQQSTTVLPGAQAVFTVKASDNVAVTQTTLSVNKVEITLDASGKGRYTFAAAGVYVVKATAVDASGNESVTTEVFKVAEVDKTRPKITITHDMEDQYSLKLGQTIRVKFDVTDDVGVTKTYFEIYVNSAVQSERYRQEIIVDADGWASIVIPRAGSLDIRACAWDAAGNRTETLLYLYAEDTGVVSGAEVSLGGHLGGSQSENRRITESTAIVASLQGDVASWRVELVDNKTGTISVLNSGVGVTRGGSSTLATIDPSVLANGSYTVRIVATDSDGVSTTTEKDILVASDVKLGNFQLPLQDSSISVGGFNIQVNRVYDSLNSGFVGDFGYGWNLGTLPYSLSVSNPFNHALYDGYRNSMAIFRESAWTNSTVISISMPDGSVAQFDVNLNHGMVHPSFGQLYTMELTCISGHNVTLKIDDANESMIESRFMTEAVGDGTYYLLHISENGYFNPTRNNSFKKNMYELTMEDGTIYRIDPQTGMATGMKAADGRTLEMTADGIVARDKNGTIIEQVKYVRDDLGRISAVVDPSGGMIRYEYDARGDLVSVTNQGGSAAHYEYVTAAGAPPHYLQTIRDTNGKIILNVDYDYATGRINGMTDANGNKTNVEYTTQSSTGHSVEKVTDASGLTTEAVMNKNGNVIRTVQHIPDASDPGNADKMSYLITIADYDAKGNLLQSARAFTVTAAELTALGKDRLEYFPTDLVWEQRNTYDAKGHCLTSTDIYGKVTTYEYDTLGNVTKTTDHYGNTSESKYDTIGRIETSTDANGVVTAYEYDMQGQLTSITQTNPGETPVVISRMTYALGRLLTSTDRNGVETVYGYDANGRQTHNGRFWTNAATGTSHSGDTYTLYNDAGQVVSRSRSVDGVIVSVSSYEYNANGQTTAEIDRHGLRTEYRYDARGQTIETRTQVKGSDGVVQWLVSRVVYDELGREIWSSDDTLSGNPDGALVCRATKTEYDILGRVVRSEVRSGVSIAVFGSPGEYTSSVVLTGSLVSYEAQGYDGAGRSLWTENTHGVKTISVYTQKGDVSHSITDLDGDLATTHDQTSTGKTIYDESGRQVASILDREDGNLSTTHDQTVTRYSYDEKGRVTETTYGDGSKTSVAYDAMGRKASETDQLGNTTHYEYDSQGRLTAVVLPRVKHPTTGAMVHARYEYGYDAMGNQTSLTDNLYQTDPSASGSIIRDGERTTRFTFDGHNRQTSRTLPDGSQEFFFYNAKGQTERHVSFEGRVTVYHYDEQDRLTKKASFTSEAAWNNGSGISGHTVAYTYDARGRVIREADSKRGATVTTYNELGQTTRVDSPTGIINYEYDAVSGQVTRTWTGSDSSNPVTDVRNSYDIFGRLETVETHAREGGIDVAKYAYDVIGNLDKLFHANGIVTDYNYDALNRLKEVIHSHDNGTPDNTADDVVVEQFVYDYHANGNKSSESATDKDGNNNVWEWDYDALGRLVQERHDNHDNDLDYTAGYVFDLVGNRLKKETVSTSGKEVVESSYDDNDRLLNERKVLDEVAVEEIVYGYNGSEQTGKTVKDLQNSRVNSTTKMSYNDQGRLSRIVIETYVNGALSKIVTQEYEYDASGIKVKQTETVDDNADGSIDSTKSTEYLNDNQNHTGYSQVLEERTSENGGAVKITTYTIGHDVLAQYDAVNGFLALLSDGHGSTRAVADMLGKILQQYNYDAYGNAHGFNPAEAMTNLLYSGEQFNPVSGLQYLRARWYNPQSGTFNRLDPFAGNMNLPLSLHKYAYANDNPIKNIDPTGKFALIALVGLLSVIAGVYLVNFVSSFTESMKYNYGAYEVNFAYARNQTYSELITSASLLGLPHRFQLEPGELAMNYEDWCDAALIMVDRYSNALRDFRTRGSLTDDDMSSRWNTGWMGNLLHPWSMGCDDFSSEMAKIAPITINHVPYFYTEKIKGFTHAWTEIRTGIPGNNDKGMIQWGRWAMTGWETGLPTIKLKQLYEFYENTLY